MLLCFFPEEVCSAKAINVVLQKRGHICPTKKRCFLQVCMHETAYFICAIFLSKCTKQERLRFILYTFLFFSRFFFVSFALFRVDAFVPVNPKEEKRKRVIAQVWKNCGAQYIFRIFVFVCAFIRMAIVGQSEVCLHQQTTISFSLLRMYFVALSTFHLEVSFAHPSTR